MTIYIIYLLIILVTIILYFLVKDKKEFLRKLGITSIISGAIILILGFILNIAVNIFLNDFNTTRITVLILQRFIYNSIFFVSLGVIELILSKIINKKKRRTTPSGNQNCE